MDSQKIDFEPGIKCYIFEGYSHQGEKWKEIDMGEFDRDQALCLLFDIMMEQKTVMMIRKEGGGVLYSVNTMGKDREGLYVKNRG